MEKRLEDDTETGGLKGDVRFWVMSFACHLQRMKGRKRKRPLH